MTILAIFRPLPQGGFTWFEQHLPGGFRGEVIWNYQLFFTYKCMGPIQMLMEANLTSPLRSQTTMYDHHFSNFGIPPVPDDLGKDSAHRHPLLWRRRFLKVFTIYGHGGHCGQWTAAILGIFRSPNLRRLCIKFEQHLPKGFRGEVVWNSEHFLHTNVWCPYKCIGKQTWPRRKKVKHQCTNITLATLVDLPPPMVYAKIQPKASSVLEKIFKGFYHIWAWRPSWSTARNCFSNLLFPQPKEAPYEIWAKFAQRLQRRSRLNMLMDGRTTDKKWSL